MVGAREVVPVADARSSPAVDVVAVSFEVEVAPGVGVVGTVLVEVAVVTVVGPSFNIADAVAAVEVPAPLGPSPNKAAPPRVAQALPGVAPRLLSLSLGGGVPAGVCAGILAGVPVATACACLSCAAVRESCSETPAVILDGGFSFSYDTAAVTGGRALTTFARPVGSGILATAITASPFFAAFCPPFPAFADPPPFA